MQSVQSVTDKKEIVGIVDGVALSATMHPTDENLAKALLMQLHKADMRRTWTLEIQCDSIAFWCDLHPTYGYRMSSKELNKGFSVIRRRGIELIERIRGGAC